MADARKDFDRILKYVGLFIIFAESRLNQEMFLAKIHHNAYEKYFSKDKKIDEDNWSFLSAFDPSMIAIKADLGVEISLTDHSNDDSFYRFLKKVVKNCEYRATFKPSYRFEDLWYPIFKSKYGDDIAGVILAKDSNGKKFDGCIIILPQMVKKSEAIVTLLKEVLPEIWPPLFPHIEGARWVERDEYELDLISNYKEQKNKAQERVKKELEELDKKIAEVRKELGFLHGIITKRSDKLVRDVKACLEFIGFKDVRDVDEEIAKKAKKTQKQEDLQIHDKSCPFGNGA